MEVLFLALLAFAVITGLARILWFWNLNKIALNQYSRTGLAAPALNKIARWSFLNQYAIILIGILFGYSSWKFWSNMPLISNTVRVFEQLPHLDGLNIIILINLSVPAILFLFCIITSNIIDTIISYKTYTTIRKTSQTLPESIFESIMENIVIVFLVMLLPLVGILIGHFIPLQWLIDWLFTTELRSSGLQDLFIMFIAIIFRFFVPCFVLFITFSIIWDKLGGILPFWRYTRIKNPDIEAFLLEILCNYGYKTIKLYESLSKKQKYADAFVVNDSRGIILISDYLIEHLTKDELKAILLHEIAHIKMRHLKKMTKSSFLPPHLKYIVFVGKIIWLGSFVGYLFFTAIDQDSRVSYILSFVVIIMSGLVMFKTFADGLVGMFMTSRKHELEADEFVIKSGIEPHVYISALRKLYYLNDSSSTLGKFEEILSTHPSLVNRIKHITEFAKT